MSKGSVNYFTHNPSMEHIKDNIKKTTGLDASVQNVEVVTEMDMAKCVHVISTAIKELGKYESEPKVGQKRKAPQGSEQL